jgi:tetratricopeptide (TPR) repeat protein
VTNNHPVEFLYGAAVLETDPSGADVQDGGGHYWGATPLSLPELLPGTLQLTLHRGGYEPVPVLLEITANQTATFHTNLISTSYTGAMKSARQYMAAADYDGALQAVGDALIAKPDDAEALSLQREATGLGKIQHAKALAEAGDYFGGEKELTLALQSLPDNVEAKQLIADYKQHEPEQIERQRQERLKHPREVFGLLCDKDRDSKLFDEHELKTQKPADEVARGISKGLVSVQPPFVINRDDSTSSDIHLVVATQKFSTGFLAGGERMCLIVVGQTKDDESQILFKVLEYQRHHHLDMNVPINQMPISEELIPVSPSRFPDMTDKLKAQLQEGVSNVTAIIQEAIGQTPADQSTAPK